MPTTPAVPFPTVLAETALAAAGGGTLLTLDTDSARPGRADAMVLQGDTILHVALDQRLGSAVVAPADRVSPRERPSRRCALAHR